MLLNSISGDTTTHSASLDHNVDTLLNRQKASKEMDINSFYSVVY